MAFLLLGGWHGAGLLGLEPTASWSGYHTADTLSPYPFLAGE